MVTTGETVVVKGSWFNLNSVMEAITLTIVKKIAERYPEFQSSNVQFFLSLNTQMEKHLEASAVFEDEYDSMDALDLTWVYKDLGLDSIFPSKREPSREDLARAVELREIMFARDQQYVFLRTQSVKFFVNELLGSLPAYRVLTVEVDKEYDLYDVPDTLEGMRDYWFAVLIDGLFNLAAYSSGYPNNQTAATWEATLWGLIRRFGELRSKGHTEGGTQKVLDTFCNIFLSLWD